MTTTNTSDQLAIVMHGVTKRFAAKDSRSPLAPAVLESVDLSVAPGEFLALLGASGCGKTTLLRLLAGLEQPSSGAIRIFGEAPAQACRHRQVGVAFQQPALVPSRTAVENVRLTLEIVGGTADGKKADPARLLSDFGLGAFLHHYPHQLSGGMRQRVNIACALVHSPRLLLLDEPFGALDELTRASMMDWLAGILARTGQTVLLVTHSVEEAICLSDRVAIFSRRPGRIAQILPVPLLRPRPEAFRATTGFLEVAAQTRQELRRILGAETNGDDAGPGSAPPPPVDETAAAEASFAPARGPLESFEQPITPPAHA
jgi:NitT/TauT family transport system ATP-binding protein